MEFNLELEQTRALSVEEPLPAVDENRARLRNVRLAHNARVRGRKVLTVRRVAFQDRRWGPSGIAHSE